MTGIDMTDGGARGDATALVRVVSGGDHRWCARVGEELRAFPAEASLGSLLSLSSAELAASFARVMESGDPLVADAVVAPVDDDTEVWAAGVTYEVSREARMDESREATIYERVYDADRPELFFKSVGWRVQGPDQAIGVRADSVWNVPEPELAVVVNSDQELVGFTICNDVSSRSIEAENPLYLPQAKCYRGGCAVGPWIVPAWALQDPYSLDIAMDIQRGGASVWSGSTSTALLHRRFDELVDHLFRGDIFPRGVILSTGTATVPPDEFTLTEGDTVVISIESVGTLSNPVLCGAGGAGWDLE